MNEFGVCLITDVPTVPGFVKKVGTIFFLIHAPKNNNSTRGLVLVLE